MSKKIDILQGAFSQIRISGLTVDPTPEDGVLAMSRLEGMMSELELTRNMCLGYNFEAEPNLNSETGVSPGLDHFMETNLAVRLIPDFNKQVPPTLVFQASQSMSGASSVAAHLALRETPYPARMPIGSGNTLRTSNYYKFFPPAEKVATCKTLKVNDVEDYAEPYHSYLKGETIASFIIDLSDSLTLVSSAINGDSIDYRLKSLKVGFETVEITTSTGRITNRQNIIEVT